MGVTESMVACEICGQPTAMTATKRCDRCWELEQRIGADPLIARKILNQAIARLPKAEQVRTLSFVLNFGHPLGEDVLKELDAKQVLITCRLDLDGGATVLQAREIVRKGADWLSRVGGRLDGTVPIYVVLPGVSEAVALVLAELCGRMGRFPLVLFLRRRGDGTYGLAQMPGGKIRCGRCDGTGRFRLPGQTLDEKTEACDACDGNGKIDFPSINGVVDLERVRNSARGRR